MTLDIARKYNMNLESLPCC